MVKEGLFFGINAENYCGNSFECPCGHTHKVSTEKVFFSARACEKFVDYIKARIGFIRVLILVKNEQDIDSAKRIGDAFLAKDFYVHTHMYFEDSDLDIENMGNVHEKFLQEKLIIAVGDVKMCDYVKYYCNKYNLLSAICCTSLNSNTYLSKFGYVLNKGYFEKFELRSVNYFVLDFDSYNFVDQRSVALSYQCVVSQFLNLFNWLFESSFENVHYCKNVVKLVMKAISVTVQASEGAINKVPSDCMLIAENALKINIAVALMEDGGFNEILTNDVLYMLQLIKKHKRQSTDLLAESELLVCLLITDIYELYLTNQIVDISVPPNLNERAVILSKLFNKKLLKVLLQISKNQCYDNYKLMQYKFDEYREDFKTRINGVSKILHFAFNQYKRIYFDTGYFLHKAIAHDEFMLALNLVNDISNGYTLLKHIVNTGILEKYVDAEAI